jgi:hypothetical protein
MLLQVGALESYLEHLDGLPFLAGKNTTKLRQLLDRYYAVVQEEKASNREGEYCREIWVRLLRFALGDLACPRGNRPESELISLQSEKFLGAAMEAEQVLLGAKRNYREHMTHSLRVYLLGEFFFERLFQQSATGAPGSEIKSLLQQKSRVVWCVAALCHDLGSALEAIVSVNGLVARLFRILGVDLGFLAGPEEGTPWRAIPAIINGLDTKVLPLACRLARVTPDGLESSRCQDREAPLRSLLSDPPGVRDKSLHALASAYAIYTLAGLARCAKCDNENHRWLWTRLLHAVARHSVSAPSSCLDLESYLRMMDELDESRTERHGDVELRFDRLWQVELDETASETRVIFSVVGQVEPQRRAEMLKLCESALNGAFKIMRASASPDSDGRHVTLRIPPWESKPLWQFLGAGILGIPLS